MKTHELIQKLCEAYAHGTERANGLKLLSETHRTETRMFTTVLTELSECAATIGELTRELERLSAGASHVAMLSTPEPNYDDPEIERRWCAAQQKIVVDYLRSQELKHGRIGEWPAWHIAPYVSIWAIQSLERPEWIGWWTICGDLPTDFISAADVKPPQHPRKALRVIGRNWLEVVKARKNGREIENTRFGDPSFRAELGPLLESRATQLMAWADDDSLWESS